MLDKHFLSLHIPTNLREKIPIKDKTSLEHYNAQWEFHTTPIYRMEYEELNTKMEGISMLSDILLYDCPEYVKNEFKNALNLYAKGYWVASISLCGIVVEYLTKFYFPKDQTISLNDKSLGNYDRINVLYGEKTITVEMRDNLLKINRIRNSIIHLDIIEYPKLQTKNIDSINTLIQILMEVSAIQFEQK